MTEWCVKDKNIPVGSKRCYKKCTVKRCAEFNKFLKAQKKGINKIRALNGALDMI